MTPDAAKSNLPEYPFDSHYMRIDGHRMHYIDEAPAGSELSKQAVLLLHGNPTWSYYYRNLISELRQTHRVIAPDWIGCGLSDHPRHSHYRAIHRIEQLEQFVQQLGLEKVSLVMHDWGGPIGTGFALRNLDKIERLVYLNTTLVETESLPAIIKNAARPFVGQILTKYTSHFVNMTTRFGVVNPVPKAIRRAYRSPYRSSALRTAIWDFVADIPFESDHPTYAQTLWMAESLPALRSKPVQIIWGLKDPCFHREMLNKVVVHFPQADVLEISNASHLVLEDAREQANRVINQFLAPVALARAERVELEIAVGASNLTRSSQLAGASSNVVQFPVTNTPWSLYRSFCEAARRSPQARACIEGHFPIEPGLPGANVHYSYTTFRDLSDLINKYQRGLRELGICPGDRVVMMVSPGLEFLALTYGILGRGAIPVFLDPGMGREKLLQCLQDCAPHAFIGVPRAHLLRLLKPAIFKGLRFKLVVSDWPIPGCKTIGVMKRFSSLPLPEVVRFGNDPALIAFTSGATGTPKGVVFTHSMLEAQLDIFAKLFGVARLKDASQPVSVSGDGELDLPLLPIFSIFTLALGVGSAFAPIDPSRPLSLEPNKIVKMIQDLSVKSSFGSPTLWNKIAEYCLRSGSSIPSLRKVFMAGAPVPLGVIERVQDCIAGGAVYTPYGSTEALPVTLVSAQEIKTRQPQGQLALPAKGGEIGVFVGKPLDGIKLVVVPAIDGPLLDHSQLQPLPAFEIGEIVVSGANVSSEYFRRDDATRDSKVKAPDGTLWHRMGDVGYLDDQGALFFCGRRVHMVKNGSQDLYSIPTERIFNTHSQVRRSALVNLKLAPGRTVAGICVEPVASFWPSTPAETNKLIDELRELAKSDPITERIVHFFVHPAFPVDARHNAKIFRDQLGEWASGELASQSLRTAKNGR